MQMLNRAKGEESARLQRRDGVTRKGALLRNQHRTDVAISQANGAGAGTYETSSELSAVPV